LSAEDETKLLISAANARQQQQQPARGNHDNDDDDDDDEEDIKRRSSAGTYSQSSDSQTDYANTTTGAHHSHTVHTPGHTYQQIILFSINYGRPI